MPAKAMYEFRLKGERLTYALAGPLTYDRKSLAVLMEDLSGYKAAYILRRLTPIKVGETAIFGHDFGVGIGAVRLVVKRIR